jgi:hypothetical protein
MKQQYDYTEDLPEATKQNITEEHFINGIIFTELKKYRYPICKECDSFNSSIKMCKECNCFMPLKTLLKNSVCPKGKW